MATIKISTQESSWRSSTPYGLPQTLVSTPTLLWQPEVLRWALVELIVMVHVYLPSEGKVSDLVDRQYTGGPCDTTQGL